MGEPRLLGSLTCSHLGQDAPILLVPLGSIEQHGPHLPLDTDIRIAGAVAHEAASDLGAACVVAPPISYGASGEHQGFAGTVSIGTPALAALVVEYGRSACAWAARLAFVNGHGGNVDALRSAVAVLRSEGRDAAWCSPAVARGGQRVLHLHRLHHRQRLAAAHTLASSSSRMPCSALSSFAHSLLLL
jgi:mycofactocin system creatininase family protein